MKVLHYLNYILRIDIMELMCVQNEPEKNLNSIEFYFIG